MKWEEALNAYYNVGLTATQRTIWWTELAAACHNLENDELVEAIRSASFQDRGKYAGKPTLKDLRMWVYMLRKSRNAESTGNSERTGCEECNGGWLDYRRSGGQYRGCGLSIPCLCGAGNNIAEEFDSGDQRMYTDMARLEMRRRREELPGLLELAKTRPLGEAIRQMCQDMSATARVA